MEGIRRTGSAQRPQLRAQLKVQVPRIALQPTSGHCSTSSTSDSAGAGLKAAHGTPLQQLRPPSCRFAGAKSALSLVTPDGTSFDLVPP